MSNISNLLNSAAIIRDATQEGENTAIRVGSFLVSLIRALNTALPDRTVDGDHITFGTNSSSFVITLRLHDLNGRTIDKTITIPLATGVSPGLMSSVNFNRLNNAIERLGQVEIYAEDLDGRLILVEDKAINANIRLTSLENGATQTNTRLTSLESSASQSNTRLTTLENGATQTNTRLASLESDAEDLDGRMSLVESNAAQANTRLDSLESIATQTNSRLTTLENSATQTDTRLDSLESDALQMDARLSLATPVLVESEEAMEAMIRGGQVVAGQIYFVAEED